MTSKALVTLFAAAVVGVTLLADEQPSPHGSKELKLRQGDTLQEVQGLKREPAAEISAEKELEKIADALSRAHELGEQEDASPEAIQ